MSPERYRAELAALTQEACDRCTVVYPVAEMGRCVFCDGIFCRTCFHPDLDVCWKHDCIYSAANRLRELRNAAITVLECMDRDYRGVGTALEILKGEKR